GFTTELEPSMTLGCGSCGGNVTSDNISPRHLMDIKRIAFETKAINRVPADTKASVHTTSPGKSDIDRAAIAELVDRFLQKRVVNTPQHTHKVAPLPQAPDPVLQDPVSAPPVQAVPAPPNVQPQPVPTPAPAPQPQSSTNN